MPYSKHNVQPVDPILTQFAVDYANSEYIADQIFPKVQVGTESGTFYVFSGKDRFRFPPTRRAPGAKYARGDLSVSTDTYTTQEDGYEIPVDKRIQANALKPLDPYRSAVETCADIILLRREKNILDAVCNTTTFASYTADLTGTDRWDNDNSEPIKKFNEIAQTIRENCGRWPNFMLISKEVWVGLKEHPVLIDKIPRDMDKIVTDEMMRKYFGVEKFLVSKALYNSAEEGQTVDLDPVMGKNCFIGWVNPTPAIDKPSVGYTIQKEGFTADSYYEDQSRGDVVRARVNEVHKIVAADCGYLLTTVVS